MKQSPLNYVERDDKIFKYWQVLETRVFGRKRPRIRSVNRKTPKPRKPFRVHHTLIK